ncbi:HAD-IC family P-type ATPase [Chelativorans sp. AA-79]|uniref:cation-translocating P-type ATPase n=1 Tax=Chelativorans sp. AA-79 TaxID=3028735 RepID=UPI0023F8E911|nr:HAD-IC family P-type ATPase [Chelativorans sp. AA-79]WEX10835.1 HAD-IC family P-type ATPase [Chelativorans sp. AA-79]
MSVVTPPWQPTAGLSDAQAAERLARFGPNALPQPRAASLLRVFLRQFLSPLIYILLAAAVVSLVMSDLKDAIFIGAVLLLNGIIGAVQEHSAGRAAAALRNLEEPHATVLRDGTVRQMDARQLVPGDLVLLEAGARVPADMELLQTEDLQCDESLLTGESAPVKKVASRGRATAFAGSMVTRGRGRGLVTATGTATELGKIAEQIGKPSVSQPPLMIRLEKFSRIIAIAVVVAIAALVGVGLIRAMPYSDLFLMAIGLAVSAIPEGLPVAISVALAIGMRRMASANVIVRRMPAIESLGSCTMIATDKTGTLTMNQLTVTDISLPDGTRVAFRQGDGRGESDNALHAFTEQGRERITRLLKAAALPNEARLVQDGDGWKGYGDTVDIALLAAAHEAGMALEEATQTYPLLTRIPYEPDLKFAASFHQGKTCTRVFVKGAPETLIAMCDRMNAGGSAFAIDREALVRQKEEMAARGLRVLAFAEGEIASEPESQYGHHHLVDLVFLGFAGMQDPVRPEVPDAIRDCYAAGIEVVMVTGDDPGTAGAIARDAGLQFSPDQVVTGQDIRRAEAEGPDALDRLTGQARIYARVDPAQKLSIVLSLARNGHFVAVTGDGVNDAPALKHAHVGVAMGRKGTDVAKESADIILTDDNFASIVAGVREGRVAYANIRKVVFMLVSTGAAEVVLFLLAFPLGLPMPLLPVQLLWLNLVTNGIQDVALAAEKAEGDELSYPPRSPNESIFDRVMIRRIWHSTLVMGLGGFAVFYWLLQQGYGEAEARNLLLLLFVLFENFQTFNSRSEHHSVFRQRLLSNPLLVLGVLAAQALHIGAMYIPWLSGVLQVAPVSLFEWTALLLAASALLAVMEFEKMWDGRHHLRLATKAS